MSVSKQVTIWCDQCQDWDQASLTAAKLRKALKVEGWTQEGTHDYCPKCSIPRRQHYKGKESMDV